MLLLDAGMLDRGDQVCLYPDGMRLSTEFAFDADGTVVSGCAGFGLERGLAAMRQAGTLQ
jgi:hypothetical protein